MLEASSTRLVTHGLALCEHPGFLIAVSGPDAEVIGIAPETPVSTSQTTVNRFCVRGAFGALRERGVSELREYWTELREYWNAKSSIERIL